MLRNAGTRVKLLIARDGPKDNHCSSPVFNQQNLDGVVGVYVCVCVPVEEKYQKILQCNSNLIDYSVI